MKRRTFPIDAVLSSIHWVYATLNEQSLFLGALEQPNGEARRIWLEQACQDLGQRTRIAALVEQHAKAGNFLEKPPQGLLPHSASRSHAMVSRITKEKFVDRLIRSKLMTAEEIAVCEAEVKSLHAAPDALTYADAMVKANKLTGFQAKAIYDGRIKGLRFGEYIILNRLGKGGMGIVYRAKHRRMDRLVAIKILPRSTMATKGLEERFYREVKTAAKLMHPNIVAALDASEDDGLHYLVMEYVEGQDLGEVLRQSGPLEPEQAVNCILQAARGLQYAHQQGVIHRDIKPANLLIDIHGTVKVLDMGLARLTGAATDTLDEAPSLSSDRANVVDGTNSNFDISALQASEPETATASDQTRLTKAGDVMGTLAYMPPEQFTDSRSVDQRGDIYSLGCTLYHLLTGCKPFPASTVEAVFRSHRNNPAPTLRSLRPDLPEHLDLVYQKMLAKEPEQRQNSMLQVIEELEKSLVSMQSPPSIPAELQSASNNAALHTNTVHFAQIATSTSSPQIVLSHTQSIRRRRRSRPGWMLAGVTACAMLLLLLLMFVQKFRRPESSVTASGSTKTSIIQSHLSNESNLTATRQPPGDESEKLSSNGETNPDGRHNGFEDIASDELQIETSGDDLVKATEGIEEESASSKTVEETETPAMATASEQENRELAENTEQSSQSDADTISASPMDWFGGANWNNSFVFQGNTAFGPSAERRVEFNHNDRKISIAENGSGITVTIDGRVVQAANRVELKKKDAEAFRLYEQVYRDAHTEMMPGMSASDLQRRQLEQLRESLPGNSPLKSLIEGISPKPKK